MPYRTTTSEQASFCVQPDIAAVPRARRQIVAVVRAWCPLLSEDTVETLELLAGEVIANAVVHTGESCRVTVVWNGARVRLEVEDTGRQLLSVSESAAPDDESGRGLHLVAGLAQAWGSWPIKGGKVVWFEIGAPSSPQTDSAPTPYEADGSPGAAVQRAPAPGSGSLTDFLSQTT